MKTPEEIKRWLVTCTELVMPADVQYAAMVDALAYIQQLERDNAQKDERIKQYEQDTNGFWFLPEYGKLPVRLNCSTRWISVEERLPERDERVICWCKIIRTGERYATTGVRGLGEANWWLDSDPDLDYEERVTHWMPLPEPPEEGEG